MVEFVLVSLLAYNFPSYFDTEQELNAAVIIDKVPRRRRGPLFYGEPRLGRVTFANREDIEDRRLWTLSRSITVFGDGNGDITTRNKFLVDMSSAAHATVAATPLSSRRCENINHAKDLTCRHVITEVHDGKSQKTKKSIITYANQVNRMRGIFKRKFPRWMER